MLDEFKKTDFNKEKGKLNVNMCGNVRTLHKQNCCYYSKYLSVFIPFENLDEVKAFENEHGVKFKNCKLCFPNKEEEEK